MEQYLIDYVNKNDNHIKKFYNAKSNSSSKKTRKNNFINSESKINKKKVIKNLHKRNILFNQKTSIKNVNSTSTSSISSSTEKKYLTPTKYNKDTNFGNDYYFNENFNNNKQDLFKNMNISRPKLDYKSNYKKIKSLHLALGSGIDRYNTIYFSRNDYGNKEIIVNRSLKCHKNKLVLCNKVNISRNNSRNNEKEKDLSSKSVENNNKNKKLNDIINNFVKEQAEKNEHVKQNNRYKNIVLRPHKVKNENQFNFQEISLKHNIKINKYKKDENPELIKNIIKDFHKKPKHSRVFKYK